MLWYSYIRIKLGNGATDYLRLFYLFTVSRLAAEQIGPYVREMENNGFIKQSVVDMLFENGVGNT